MALVVGDINWQGHGKVTDADNTTNWGTIKLTSGGASPGAALADGGLQAATGSGQAIATTSNSKRMLLYYDIGAGNELDFTASTGNEAGQFVYVWGNVVTAALAAQVATGGLGIMLGTDSAGTVNWSYWSFYGRDNYDGGWRRMCIDPTKTATATGAGTTTGGGGITISSVRYFGIMAYCDISLTLGFDNVYCDRIDVGTGYAVDGTGGTADGWFQDLLTLEQGTANQWGIIQSRNEDDTALELLTKLTIGDNAGTVATTVTDVNTKLFAANPKYYSGGLVAALPLTATGIEIVGNATGATSVTLGKAVGTTEGRSGLTFVGNDTYDVGIDFDDGNVNNCNIYGCSFENLTGTLSWGTNTAHKMFSTTFTGCEQVDLVGGAQIRNCNFVNTVSLTGAILWNSSIDIQSCNFLANTTGEGIEHDTIISVKAFTCDGAGSGTVCTLTGSDFLTSIAVNDYVYNETDGSYAKVTSVDSNTQFTCDGLANGSDNTFTSGDAISVSPAVTYTNLNFSGNTNDVTNSATGSDALFISKSGTSNPSTSTGTAVFIGSVPITITVKDSGGAVIQNAQTGIFLTSDGTTILNTDTNASGVASTSYTGSTPVEVKVWIRKASSGATKYKNYSSIQNISTSGLTLDVTLVEDPNNNATS